MSFGDYAKETADIAKNKIKNDLKKAIWPIIVKVTAVVIAILFPILVVLAIAIGSSDSDNLDFMSLNGFFYGDTIEEKVWFALRGAGYSEYSTAGVMGNIYAESGFRADAIEGGYTFQNGGIGLCQWTSSPRTSTDPNDRKNRLINYAKSKGVEWSDEDTQIEYLLGEVNKSGGANGYAVFQMSGTHYGYTYNSWKDADNTSVATRAFMAVFERPNMNKAHTSTREEKAQEYYNKYHGKTAPTGGSFGAGANDSAMQQLEYKIEKEHNLVASGAGFKSNYGTNNAASAGVKKKVTGTFHGWSYGNVAKNGLQIYQCTWWANGRASEFLSKYGTKYKKYPTISGNGGEYFRINKSNGWFNYGKMPKPNSLLCTAGVSSAGHIAYVEAVDYENKVYYTSEAGGGTHWDGILKHSFSSYNLNGTTYGFIYLMEPAK